MTGAVCCVPLTPAFVKPITSSKWLDLGETEIENLALLCVRHHHQIHETGLILIRDGPNRWHVAPKPPNPNPNPNTHYTLAV